MTWWGWVLVWVALFVAAGVVFFLLARGLWRQGKALFGELGTASERLGAVMEQVDALGETAVERRLAVFDDPVALRRRREADARRRAREKEQRRRALLAGRRRP